MFRLRLQRHDSNDEGWLDDDVSPAAAAARLRRKSYAHMLNDELSFLSF